MRAETGGASFDNRFLLSSRYFVHLLEIGAYLVELGRRDLARSFVERAWHWTPMGDVIAHVGETLKAIDIDTP